MDRRRSDRRASHVLFSDWRFALKGRRRADRRYAAAVRSKGLDRHHPWLLVVAVAIVVLSAADAIFTLELIARGLVHEANPFMRWLMELDLQIFANFKLLLTGFAVVVLVACSTTRFLRRVPTHAILHSILFFYVGLIGYELFLLNR